MGGSVRYGTAGINNINFYLVVPEVPVVCIKVLLLFYYYYFNIIINLKKNNKGR